MSCSMKYKGLYLVTEPRCLIKGTGAYHHIQVGLKHLNNRFDVKLITVSEVNKKTKPLIKETQDRIHKESNFRKFLLRIGIMGTLIDLKTFIENHRDIFKFYHFIKLQKPHFIYERASYLNFNGMIVCRLLNLPHIIEVNGLYYQAKKRYYLSFVNFLVKWSERKLYKFSSYTFFIGLWGNLIGSKKKNWSNIENGIELSFISQFSTHTKKIEDKINLCFIGYPMKHHNLSLLVEAIKNCKNKKNLHLHLIGKGLDTIATDIEEYIDVTTYSFVERDNLVDILKKMHVGLIPGSHDYASNMKLFDYGSAKCIVIAPSLPNIIYWFSMSEMLLFKKDDVNDLTRIIELINKDFIEKSQLGEKLYKTIKENFLWEKIFASIENKINEVCEERFFFEK